MSYDFETGGPLPSERYKDLPPPDPRDPEAIEALLSVAAIFLTDEAGATFTAEALIAEAQRLGGDEVPISEGDTRIVLDNVHFLAKGRDGRLRLR